MKKKHYFTRWHLLSLVLSILTPTVFAQTAIKGRVLDHKGAVVPYASIRLLTLPDSSQVLASAVNSNDGSFALSLADSLQVNKLILQASCLGYKSQSQPIGREEIIFRLEEDSRILSAVQVVSRAKGQQIDSRAFTFEQEVRKYSKSSQDLLRFIPDLRVDLAGGSITSISNGTVRLLINGIPASAQELQSIPAKAVKEVVYYDIPPARYSDYGAVVDVIAPSIENGIQFGLQGYGAFSTGYTYGYSYLNINKGRHQLRGSYNLNHRAYEDRQTEREYAFVLNGERRHTHQSIQDKFGYTTHNPSLRYTYHEGKRQILQVTFKPEIYKYYNDGLANMLYTRGSREEQRKVDIHAKNRYWAPRFDTYYSLQLNDKQEVAATLGYSLYNTKAENQTHEKDLSGVSILNDQMHLKNTTHSFSGEVAYRHRLGSIQWNTGYRYKQSITDYNVSNLYGDNQYTTKEAHHYAYTEWRGNIKSLSYLASLGLTHLSQNNAGTKHHLTLFTPSLTLSRVLGKEHRLRLRFMVTPYSPGASLVSDNRRYTVDGLIYRGNPDLHSSQKYTTRLYYNYTGKQFSLNSQVAYMHTQSPLVVDYRLASDGKNYEESYFNADRESSLFASLQAEYKLFNGVLSLKGYIAPQYTTLSWNGVKHSYLSIGNSIDLTLMTKIGLFAYSVSIPTWRFASGSRSYSHEQHIILFRTGFKNWEFGLGFSVIGSPTIYKGQVRDGLAVAYKYHTRIYDNKNMLLLGLGYKFSKGNKKEAERSLEEHSSSAVTF